MKRRWRSDLLAKYPGIACYCQEVVERGVVQGQVDMYPWGAGEQVSKIGEG